MSDEIRVVRVEDAVGRNYSIVHGKKIAADCYVNGISVIWLYLSLSDSLIWASCLTCAAIDASVCVD